MIEEVLIVYARTLQPQFTIVVVPLANVEESSQDFILFCMVFFHEFDLT